MSQQQNDTERDAKEAVRHPLLVYVNLGRRYRAPGLMLIIVSVVLFLPLFISGLRTDAVKPEALATLGLAVLLAGIGFWFFAWLALNRAYVQCQEDLMLVRTPFYKTRMSYRRIKSVQPVKVVQVFPKEELKGMSKALVTPLLGMTAVELHVSSWPAPKRRLERLMGRFLFSKRAEAWVFVVPNYSILMRQIDTALQLKADERRRARSSYRSPLERMYDRSQ